ncbi:GTPase [Solibacillus sp. R5-41]|uniref:GTPase n=1 Tax=Solibacillus sp. R5-41 TaxID=2048654 RepID=UPI000C127243|nr:GTPase [Solibacillus sp. R5-41]ATP41101.1 GTPase [Solibacillus sp. R5-41]
MNVEMKNELLNLPSLKFTIDEIVFDHIDTKPNWSKAYEMLDEILRKMANNYNVTIHRNNGEIPKSSTYWVLYMDVAAKLIYFTGLSQAHLIDEHDVEAKMQIIKLYQKSAACLPNASLEMNEEFVEELLKSIEQICPQNDVTSEITTNHSIEECLSEFYTLTKTYE